MPTLTLRTVGMSHLVEGLGAAGLDAAALFHALRVEFGDAVTSMGVPPEPEASPPVEAILIDRSAVAWDPLRARLEALVHAQGYSFTSWAESGLAKTPAATLHFHR